MVTNNDDADHLARMLQSAYAAAPLINQNDVNIANIAKAVAWLVECELERRRGPRLAQMEEFIRGVITEVKSNGS